MLKDAGYYTFGIGKMHWYPQRAKHGFDGTLLDESGRRQDPILPVIIDSGFRCKLPGRTPMQQAFGGTITVLGFTN